MKTFKKMICILMVLTFFSNVSFVVGAETTYSNEYFNAKDNQTSLSEFFKKHENDYVVHDTFKSKQIDRLLDELDEINSSINVEKLKFSSQIRNNLTEEEMNIVSNETFSSESQEIISNEVKNNEEVAESIITASEKLNRYNEIIDELNSIGAIPSTEEVKDMFESNDPTIISTDNISTMSASSFNPGVMDFYDGYFNFVVNSKTVTVGSTTYQCKDLVVKENPNETTLSKTYNIVLCGGKGDAVLDTLLEYVFQTVITDVAATITTTLTNSNVATAAVTWTLGAVMAMANCEDDDVVELVTGNTYTVQTTLTSSIHFVYVYDETSDDWIHCLSTNYVVGDELHVFSYRYYDCSTSRNATRYETVTTTRTSRYRFSYRYSDAVTVFRAYTNKLLVKPADNNIRTIKYSGQRGSKAASVPFAIYPLNLEKYV